MSRATDCRVEIHGVHFDDVDHAAVVAHIVDDLAQGRGGWVVTPNVDFVRQVSANPELANLIDAATLSILDGAPVQWAGRIAGRPPVHRTQGSSLADPLATQAQARGIPILLLGGRPGAAEQGAERLRAQHPGLVVRHHCPPMGFEHDPHELARVVEAVRQVEGGIVLVGLGFPKQERLSLELSARFPSTWFLGLGGTIDFLGGYVPRAPRWMQDAGFEWAFRLLVEPRRLARRYLVDGLPFAARLLAWALHERLALRRRPAITAGPATAPALSGTLQRIDLDRRVVEVAAGDDAVVEFTVSEYLAESDRVSAAPPAQEEVEQVIDLREPSSDPSAPAGAVPLPRKAEKIAAGLVPAARQHEQDEEPEAALPGPYRDAHGTR